jgi:hypothetical protein
MKFVKLLNPILHKVPGVNPNYLFVDVVDAAIHIDITTIENIHNLKSKVARDFMFIRNEISILSTTSIFINLSTSEKRVVAEYNACAKADALTVLSAIERLEFNKLNTTRMKEARAIRIERSRQVIGNLVFDGVLTYADSNDLLDKTSVLFNAFIDGGNLAFSDWLNSVGLYTLDGFSFQTYYTVEVRDELLGIINSGNI